MKSLTFVFLLLLSAAATAQTPEYVYVEKGLGQLKGSCVLANEVVTPSGYKKILEDPRCARLIPADIDLSTKTLITYRVGGDCRMRVDTFITLNRTTNTYVVNVQNYWGRCRAGGSYNGWLVIEKIPENSDIVFVETKSDSAIRIGTELQPRIFPKSNTNFIEFNMRNCVAVNRGHQIVIQSRSQYLKLVRNDLQNAECVKFGEQLDFDQFAYLGVNISTGYCKTPKNLRIGLQKFNGSNLFVVNVTYLKNIGVCRALSRYVFWLRTAKPQKPYTIKVVENSYPGGSKS